MAAGVTQFATIVRVISRARMSPTLDSLRIHGLGFAILRDSQKNPIVKRSLGLLIVLFLLTATSPLGGANAASPKVGSKCTKLNQKIKVSQQIFLCSKSGKKLVWVKLPSPTPSPGPVASSEPVPAIPSEPSTSQNSPQPNPSSSSLPAPTSNILEKKPVSLSSPTITGAKSGVVPSIGQVLTCSGWKWDQVVPQTIVSWIAYPSNTGSDIIDPKLYSILSEVVAIGDAKLEISKANIEKISGNYLYCFATAKTAGGLETTSIAAILLGK